MPRSSFYADVETKAYINALKILGRDALPDVAAESLNQTADAVTRQGLRNIKKRMIVRTKYTTNSLTNKRAQPYQALNTARGNNIGRMFSRAGSFSTYLATQETGDTVDAEGRRIPIPTLAARTAKSRQKSIARRYRLNQLGDLDGGGRFFIGEPRGGNRPLGIYMRHNTNKRLTMLRNLESRSVRVPATHWHRDAARRYGTQQFIAAQFREAARRRLHRVQGLKR